MYNLRISEYIKTNMETLHMTYQKLESLSGVPVSTLHAYAKATITTPKEDTLIRIAAAFGDAPEVIRKIKQECDEAMSREKKILDNKSKEPHGSEQEHDRMQEFAGLLRTSLASMLDEYRTQSATQQTEIIEHADRRVEEEHQRADRAIEDERSKFNERVNEVLRQCSEEVQREKDKCAEEISRNKDFCEERISLTKQHYEARISDLKEHIQQLLDREDKHGGEMLERDRQSSEYLRSCVRNLSWISVLFGITSIISVIYSVYAYCTFDIHDPTQGLHQDHYSAGPMLLIFCILLVAAAAYRVILIISRHPRRKGGEQLPSVENQN